MGDLKNKEKQVRNEMLVEIRRVEKSLSAVKKALDAKDKENDLLVDKIRKLDDENY